MAKLRTIVPATQVRAATTKTLLAVHEKEHAPKCVRAEGFNKEGLADAHLVTMRIVMERSAVSTK